MLILWRKKLYNYIVLKLYSLFSTYTLFISNIILRARERERERDKCRMQIQDHQCVTVKDRENEDKREVNNELDGLMKFGESMRL